MRTNRDFYLIIIGALWVILTAALLLIANSEKIKPEISYVVMILAGMTGMASLSTIQKFIELDRSGSSLNISFNETLLTMSISDISPEIDTQSEIIERDRRRPWELTAGQLVGIDNALALARLRMDIERELRRIAYESLLDLSNRPLGVMTLARELQRREILHPTFVDALKEIIDICNRGVHGEEVSNKMTASVVRVGAQFLEKARLLPKLREPKVNLE